MTPVMTRAQRLLPHDLVAEASVLGGVLLRAEVLLDLPELEVDDFYDDKHKIVFGAMRTLEAAGRPIDTVTLHSEIARQGRADAIGGIAFLAELTLQVPTSDNVIAYAATVRQKRVARRLMIVASEILERGYEADLDVAEYVTIAQGAISGIEHGNPDQTAAIGDLAREQWDTLEQLAQARARGEKVFTGLPTGVAELDATMGGWQTRIVNVIAARPSMGKSSLSIATADACSLAGHGVHAFSLEDDAKKYTARQLARLSGVAVRNILAADLRGDEIAHVFRAKVELERRSGWLLDERGGLTALDIVRSMRRHQSKNKTRVGIVDYLQMLKPRDSRMKDHEHLADCMSTFAESAKVDDVAWIVLSQLNRELEKRDDKRPKLSDLRGSGEIEEKCKIAVGMYRGARYGGRPRKDVDYECSCPEGVKSCAHAPSFDQWEQQVQLLVMKNSNGPTGPVLAGWHGETTKVW